MVAMPAGEALDDDEFRDNMYSKWWLLISAANLLQMEHKPQAYSRQAPGVGVSMNGWILQLRLSWGWGIKPNLLSCLCWYTWQVSVLQLCATSTALVSTWVKLPAHKTLVVVADEAGTIVNTRAWWTLVILKHKNNHDNSCLIHSQWFIMKNQLLHLEQSITTFRTSSQVLGLSQQKLRHKLTKGHFQHTALVPNIWIIQSALGWYA